MTETVYVTSSNTAVFRCPHCQRTKNVDVSTFGETKQPLRFKVKCPCGQTTVSVIEKRRRYRKETRLPGTYVHYVDGQPKGKGPVEIKDISTTGMKLLIATRETFAVGDLLKVSFQLDDPPRSHIQKKVLIRNISHPLIGTEFAPTETLDKALGFYLRS
jgi:glutaredoxin